jgi:rod shape-determining protein MreD
MNGANWARLLVVVVVGLLLQVCVLDEITVFGAHADVMVLIAAAAGMAGGPERGALGGFVAGLFADLVVNLPYGLSPLTFVLVGFAAGLVRSSVVSSDIGGAQFVATALAGIAGTLLYGVIGAITGQHGMLGAQMEEALFAVFLGSLVLTYPALAGLRWVFSGTREKSALPIPPGGSAMT